MKECPRCHALMFDDMSVCYDCLYSFKLENISETNFPPALDDVEEPDTRAVSSDSGPTALIDSVISAEPSSEKGRAAVATVTHTVTIGRAKSNDVVLEEPNISRKHAKVVFSTAGIFLEDLASTNGVRLNGKRFRGTGRIMAGDIIGVGNSRLKVLPETVALMP